MKNLFAFLVLVILAGTATASDSLPVSRIKRTIRFDINDCKLGLNFSCEVVLIPKGYLTAMLGYDEENSGYTYYEYKKVKFSVVQRYYGYDLSLDSKKPSDLAIAYEYLTTGVKELVAYHTDHFGEPFKNPPHNVLYEQWGVIPSLSRERYEIRMDADSCEKQWLFDRCYVNPAIQVPENEKIYDYDPELKKVTVSENGLDVTMYRNSRKRTFIIYTNRPADFSAVRPLLKKVFDQQDPVIEVFTLKKLN